MLLYISEIGEFWCKSGVGREHIRRRCTPGAGIGAPSFWVQEKFKWLTRDQDQKLVDK
jgi:hypothetical protein